MKIVIEIDNEHYERIMRLEEDVTVYPTTLALYEAVKNGTPLEAHQNRCDSCTHSEEQDGSNCYECVKGMADKFEAQPSEDTEVITVSKGAVKARQGRFVIYDVDWLKKNFYATEEKIYGQLKQPSEDCISRQAVIDCINLYPKIIGNRSDLALEIKHLPFVTPRTNLAETSQDCISILNRIMEYTYGMLTAEKIGLQHLIKSMMDELNGGDPE